MNKYLIESLEDGSHGVIPDEGINYFISHNRITVHKDGKKVIDKVLDVNPDGTISKYNLCCDEENDPKLEPVSDVEEYHIANMLPQTMPDDTILKKQEVCSESDNSANYISDDNLPKFTDAFIEMCNHVIDNLSSSAVTESSDTLITETSNDVVEEGVIADTAKEIFRIAKSTLEKIIKFIIEKLNLLKDLKKEKDDLKKNDIKKKIIKNEKDYRSTIKNFPDKAKSGINKIYNGVNNSTIDRLNQAEIQRQVNEFNMQMLRDNQAAMNAHQTAMDMHNQAVQQNMMNFGMAF